MKFLNEMTLREVIERMKAWSPEDKPDWPKMAFYGKDGYEKGDENVPFFTEAYLYNLLGKEDARTLLAYFNRIEALAKRKRA